MPGHGIKYCVYNSFKGTLIASLLPSCAAFQLAAEVRLHTRAAFSQKTNALLAPRKRSDLRFLRRDHFFAGLLLCLLLHISSHDMSMSRFSHHWRWRLALFYSSTLQISSQV